MDKVTDEKIKSLMGKTWGIDPLHIPSDIEFNSSHYWDSLGHVNLILGLEKEYNISINYETVTQLTSLKKIAEFVNNSS